MQVIHIFSIVYIFLFAIVIVLEGIIRLKFKQNSTGVFFSLFALSLANIAFCKQPPRNWDLTTHFILMDQIRKSSISLVDFLFDNPAGIGRYPKLISFNFIRYILSKISDNNHWLPWTMVLIDYCIIGYIIVDWCNENEKDHEIKWLSLLLCFSLLPYAHANSGMRNATACCLMGLGLYLYLYKQKSIAVFALLSFVSVTIHPATLICIPFVFISALDFGKKGLIAVFGISASIGRIAKYFTTLNNSYFSLIGKMYMGYSGDNQFQVNRVILYVDILLVCLFFILCLLSASQYREVHQRRIFNYLMYYMCYILGNIGNNDLVVRPIYLLGVLAPVLTTLLTRKIITSNALIRNIQVLIFWMCIALCGYLVVRYTVSYIR